MTLEELARRVYADRRKAAERAKRLGLPPVPWYMVSLGHPVMRTLYDRWKAEQGLRREVAPGDDERTMFELSLMNNAVLQELEAYFDRVDNVWANSGREAPDGADSI